MQDLVRSVRLMIVLNKLLSIISICMPDRDCIRSAGVQWHYRKDPRGSGVIQYTGSPANSLEERGREIHYVHSASLAYEDGIVFMSEPSAARQ